MERRAGVNFIHIADTHLGMQPDPGKHWSKKRAEELWDTFRTVIQICNEKLVDLLLISGDLFHHRPLKREVKEVNYLFSTLKHTKVVLIAGNHDYISKGTAYEEVEWAKQVTMLSQETIQSVYFPELDTEVSGFSYHSREITERLYDDVSRGERGRIQILLGHGGDERHVPFDRKQLAKAGFDYVALGHIHKPELWLEEKMAYAGALEPTDKNDMGQHGYIIGEIELNTEKTKAITQFKLVPIAKREYVSLRSKVTVESTNVGLLENIASMIVQNGEENIYKITLEGNYDPEAPLNPDLLYRTGNVVQVIDETKPDYDVDILSYEHQEDVIGMYIQEFQKESMEEKKQKALFYGINALLKQEES